MVTFILNRHSRPSVNTYGCFGLTLDYHASQLMWKFSLEQSNVCRYIHIRNINCKMLFETNTVMFRDSGLSHSLRLRYFSWSPMAPFSQGYTVLTKDRSRLSAVMLQSRALSPFLYLTSLDPDKPRLYGLELQVSQSHSQNFHLPQLWFYVLSFSAVA